MVVEAVKLHVRQANLVQEGLVLRVLMLLLVMLSSLIGK